MTATHPASDAWFAAIGRSSYERISMLIARYPDIIDVQYRGNGFTALMYATELDPAVVKLLISKGANLHLKNDRGQTAFDLAQKWTRSETTKTLKRAFDREEKKTLCTAMRDAMLARIDKMEAPHRIATANQDLIRSCHTITTVRARPQ